MNKYFLLLLIFTAIAQMLGVIFTWIFFEKFKKHRNTILIIEVLLMFLISLEILFFSISKAFISVIGAVIGIFLFALVDQFAPHRHSGLKWLSGLVFLAMCLHEFPEGLAFGSSYLINQNVGILTAILVSLHNIPEGSIVALPYLLKNKIKEAFSLAAITQVLYIIGGLVSYYFLISLSSTVQSFSASIAAGIMIVLAIAELKFLD